MFITTPEQLIDRAIEVSDFKDGPFARFYSSAQEMGHLVKSYMDKMGAPEEEKDHLIGHYGLHGETNNTINQLLLNIHTDAEEASPRAYERILRRAFLLSTLEEHGSQYSHKLSDAQPQENVIAACNRIINDIGCWTDDHVAEIEPYDRIKILSLRHDFAQALDEIYDFIEETRCYFRENQPDFAHIPPAALQRPQPSL